VSIYDFPMFIGISQLATKEMPWGYAETVPPRRSKRPSQGSWDIPEPLWALAKSRFHDV
jgi:hypothetical protein